MSDYNPVTEFLLYIASCADQKRFYPFPKEFRTESKDTDVFASYTDDEFKHVHLLITNCIMKISPNEKNTSVYHFMVIILMLISMSISSNTTLSQNNC